MQHPAASDAPLWRSSGGANALRRHSWIISSARGQSIIVGGYEIGQVKPAAETERKRTQDPLKRMPAAETITQAQMIAAIEIRSIYQAVTRPASALADRRAPGRAFVHARVHGAAVCDAVSALE